MKALVLEEPEVFRLADREEPSGPGPGQALVQVHRVGICGTDIAGYLGRMPFFRYPVIPGHELGVEVLELGEECQGVRVGDRCSVEPYINRPGSSASRSGHPNCCQDLEVLGVHRDGGLRPRFLMPARKLHPSRQLGFEDLALVETLAIGAHAVDRGKAMEGERVLVIGAGPIGLSAIVFARLASCRVAVLDLDPGRLSFCRERMGVEQAVEAGEGAKERLDEITGGLGFPLVIDATGSHRSMSSAVHWVAAAGRLVFVGISTSDLSFPHPVLHRREMTLLASRNALPGDFGRIIGLIESGAIDTAPWITHRTGFRDLASQFPSYTRRETGVVKAMVSVSDE